MNMDSPKMDKAGESLENIMNVCKTVRCLLNKITLKTFDELATEFCALNICKDDNLLRDVIDVIFEKAMCDTKPDFCPIYAELCKRKADAQHEELKKSTPRAQKIVPLMGEEMIPFWLRTFECGIINKSQQILASSASAAKIETLKKKKVEEKLTEQEIAALDEEIEAVSSKEKRRMIGNIRFIVQLYRLEVFGLYLINHDFSILMREYEIRKDENYLEYAIELLKTVGPIYSESGGKKRQSRSWAALFPKPVSYKSAFVIKSGNESGIPTPSTGSIDGWLRAYCMPDLLASLFEHKAEVSPRIRFKMLDLEDLYKRKWKPRGGKRGPKTIDEVEAEPERKKMKKEKGAK